MIKYSVSVVFVLFAGATAHGEIPKFLCDQLPGQANQVFEAGYLSCGKGNDSSDQASIKTKINVCQEPAYCTALTPEIKAEVAKELPAGSPKFDDLRPEEAAKYLRVYFVKNPTKITAKPSILVCGAEDNGGCPPASRCQEDLFFNMKAMNGGGFNTSGFYPKAPEGKDKTR